MVPDRVFLGVGVCEWGDGATGESVGGVMAGWVGGWMDEWVDGVMGGCGDGWKRRRCLREEWVAESSSLWPSSKNPTPNRCFWALWDRPLPTSPLPRSFSLSWLLLPPELAFAAPSSCAGSLACELPGGQ